MWSRGKMRLSDLEGGWIKYEIRGGKKIESDCKTGEHLGRKKGIWQACQMEGGRSVHRRLVLDSVWALAALAVTPKVLEVGA